MKNPNDEEEISINELGNQKFHELLNEMYPSGYTQEQHDSMKLMYISGLSDGMSISEALLDNAINKIKNEEK